MLDPILLIGGGGHAKCCIDVIEQENRYRIVGFVGLPHERDTYVLGYPFLGTEDALPYLLKTYTTTVLIAIGQIKTVAPRRRIFEHVRQLNAHLPTIISPLAYVSRHARIGAGSIIMHGAIINAGVQVGDNCIINTKALLEHDVEVADYCHISTASTLNGAVKVNTGTFIGSGCQIRQSVIVGKDCLIGIGQTVLNDCEDGTWIPLRKENE